MALAFTAIVIYGINSWVGLLNQDQQVRNEEAQIENQKLITKQIGNESARLDEKIEKKFDDLDVKRTAASNKTWSLILEAIRATTDIEKNVNNNLSDHRRIANLTYDELKGQNAELKEQTELLKQIILTAEQSANKSLFNQENYFAPYFNETFQKIFKALDIKDTSSNLSLIGPR